MRDVRTLGDDERMALGHRPDIQEDVAEYGTSGDVTVYIMSGNMLT